MESDLCLKSNALIGADDVRHLIIPQYRRAVDLVHASGKPFLLHSCGNIFTVMNNIISARIDQNIPMKMLFPPTPTGLTKTATE